MGQFYGFTYTVLAEANGEEIINIRPVLHYQAAISPPENTPIMIGASPAAHAAVAETTVTFLHDKQRRDAMAALGRIAATGKPCRRSI